jgi:hypothetical protein
MAATGPVMPQPLSGTKEYEEAVDRVIDSAVCTVRVFDNILSAGFNSAQRYAALRRLLLSSRRSALRIVVHEPRSLDRNCPRLLALLRQFGHLVQIHETHPAAKAVYDPFVIADERGYVRRFHFDQTPGTCAIEDPIGARALIDRFEEIWEASSPAVNATTLGL